MCAGVGPARGRFGHGHRAPDAVAVRCVDDEPGTHTIDAIPHANGGVPDSRQDIGQAMHFHLAISDEELDIAVAVEIARYGPCRLVNGANTDLREFCSSGNHACQSGGIEQASVLIGGRRAELHEEEAAGGVGRRGEPGIRPWSPPIVWAE